MQVCTSITYSSLHRTLKPVAWVEKFSDEQMGDWDDILQSWTWVGSIYGSVGSDPDYAVGRVRTSRVESCGPGWTIIAANLSFSQFRSVGRGFITCQLLDVD